MTFIIILLLSYLIGSIPFGLLVGFAVKGIDVRKFGSGNLGATNVFRVIGKKWGILVLLLDAAKGYFAVGFSTFFLPDPAASEVLMASGVAAIIGHTFPVWLNFKGGKGVATSLGVFLALAWLPTLLTFGLWIIVFLITRIISASSVAAALLFPVMIYVTSRGLEIFRYLFPLSLVLVLFIFYTHRSNLSRLLKGEEKRLF